MRSEMSVIFQKHVLSAAVTASKLDIFSIAAFFLAPFAFHFLTRVLRLCMCERPMSARGSQLLSARICIKTITPPYVCAEFKVGLLGKAPRLSGWCRFMGKNSDCLNLLLEEFIKPSILQKLCCAFCCSHNMYYINGIIYNLQMKNNFMILISKKILLH